MWLIEENPLIFFVCSLIWLRICSSKIINLYGLWLFPVKRGKKCIDTLHICTYTHNFCHIKSVQLASRPTRQFNRAVTSTPRAFRCQDGKKKVFFFHLIFLVAEKLVWADYYFSFIKALMEVGKIYNGAKAASLLKATSILRLFFSPDKLNRHGSPLQGRLISVDWFYKIAIYV